MTSCLKCKCLSCEKIKTCQYHYACSMDNGQVSKEYVDECKDYNYSKEVDEYYNR